MPLTFAIISPWAPISGSTLASVGDLGKPYGYAFIALFVCSSSSWDVTTQRGYEKGRMSVRLCRVERAAGSMNEAWFTRLPCVPQPMLAIVDAVSPPSALARREVRRTDPGLEDC